MRSESYVTTIMETPTVSFYSLKLSGRRSSKTAVETRRDKGPTLVETMAVVVAKLAGEAVFEAGEVVVAQL